MADDRNRLRKIASNLSEEGRRKELESASNVRRDIEETLGTDVVNQDKLEDLAEKIWLAVPVQSRGKFSAEDWRAAIHDRCTTALMRAEEKLAENKTDERMFIAKIKILRQTFGQQVLRAMQTVSRKYGGN